MLTKEFGKRLKYWRKKRGLSVPQLARRSELGEIQIGSFESGRTCNPTLKTFQRLLNGLGISIVDFYSEKLEEEKE